MKIYYLISTLIIFLIKFSNGFNEVPFKLQQHHLTPECNNHDRVLLDEYRLLFMEQIILLEEKCQLYDVLLTMDGNLFIFDDIEQIFIYFLKEFSEGPSNNEELPEILQKVPLFLKMKSKFKDEVLLETVMKILKFYCSNRNYEEKRDSGKVVGKKIKFFSWGGK